VATDSLFYGPDRIIVLNEADTELYLSTSDGAAWSMPVNVTNNAGRERFNTYQTSIASHVASASYWYVNEDTEPVVFAVLTRFLAMSALRPGTVHGFYQSSLTTS